MPTFTTVQNSTEEPERRVRWEKRQRYFRKQVIGLLSNSDIQYVIHLGMKRAKDYAADEYNYCRIRDNRIVLKDTDGILEDISMEIEQTIFDRLLFSGRITEADYDDAMYERECGLDGLKVYKMISGVALQIWHNEDAARRFVGNDVEHDSAYYGADDNVEIIDNFDADEDAGHFSIRADNMIALLGWKSEDAVKIEQAILVAENLLSEKNKKAFVEFCEAHGKGVKASGIYFFNDDAFCQYLMGEAIEIEKLAREELFRLLFSQCGTEVHARIRKELKYIFALALYFRLVGHPIPLGDKKIGNILLKKTKKNCD